MGAGSSLRLQLSARGNELLRVVELSTPDFTDSKDVARVRDNLYAVCGASDVARAAFPAPEQWEWAQAAAQAPVSRLMYKLRIYTHLGVYRRHPYDLPVSIFSEPSPVEGYAKPAVSTPTPTQPAL